MSNSTRTFYVHPCTGKKPDQKCSRKSKARGQRSAHCPPVSQTPEFGKLTFRTHSAASSMTRNFGGGKVYQLQVMTQLQGLCVTFRRCSGIKRCRFPPNPSTARGVDSLMSFQNLNTSKLRFEHWNKTFPLWAAPCRVIKWIITGDIKVLNLIRACKRRRGKAWRSQVD